MALADFQSRKQLQQQLTERDLERKQQQQQADAAFAAIVAPLEAFVGRPLAEPGRTACRQAFDEHASGFAAIAADVLERGRNPLALLCKLVKDGDHRAATAPRGALEQALSWADNAGRLLEVDHREEILADYGLNEEEAARVRLRWLTPAGGPARYSRVCDVCGAHPCICDRLAP